MHRSLIFWLIIICFGYAVYKFKDGFNFAVVGNKPSPPTSQSQGSTPPGAQPVEQLSADQVPNESSKTDQAQLGLEELAQKVRDLTAGVTSKKVTPVEARKIVKTDTHFTYAFQNRPVPDKESLSSLGDKILVDPLTNSISGFNASSGLLDILRGMDVPQSSYQVEVIVVFARVGSSEELGVEWFADAAGGLPKGLVASGGGGRGYSVGYQTDWLRAVLTANITSGRAVVDSRPSVQVLTGETALVSAGREVAVPVVSRTNFESKTSVEFKAALLSVEVTLLELGSGNISVALSHTNNEVGAVKIIDGNEIPELQVSTLDTRFLVRPGAWYPAGGVNVVSEESARAGATYLSSLPVLGPLFRTDKGTIGKVDSMLWLRVGKVASGISLPGVPLLKENLWQESEPPELPRHRRKWNPFRRKK